MQNRLLILGDVMLGENLYHFKRGIRTLYSQDYQALITTDVREELFEDVAAVFFNLECSLVPDDFLFSDIDTSIYRAPVKFLTLFDNKITRIANIANNHFGQHGKRAAAYSIAALKQQGYYVVGETNHPTTVVDQNIKIWGVSLVKDKKSHSTYFKSTYSNLINELYLPDKKSDEIWGISIHWGDEYIKTPSNQQIKLAHHLVDCGFDLIIGHHPHVVQPVEAYKNSLVIYSLGNFIFDQNFSKITQQGLAVKHKLKESPLTCEVYQTFQSKYQVVKAARKSSWKNVQKKKFYNLLLWVQRNKSRVLMKLELIFNFKQIDKRVLKYLGSRLIKRIIQ